MDKLYDLTALHEMLDGNEEEIKGMVEMFVTITPGVLEDLKQASDNKDWITAGDIAHKIKSSLKMMGIFELADEALFIEKNGRTRKNTDVLPEKITNLSKTLTKIVEQMKSDMNI